MRRLAAMLLACLTASAAHAESDAETLRRLDECFARTRMADAICENSLGVNAARLDCLKKSRDAQKECLDHVRMGPSAAVPAGAPSVAPEKTSSGGWTIGETTSPVDFSPLLVAELRPVAPASDGAPTALLLRCKSARTELSVRSQRTWRPSRAGDIDVAMQTDGQETGHLRWLLSQDGRTAILPQDAAEIVRAWRGSRVSIAVTDGGGSGGASIFDLSGVETVRARLAAACHWPPSRTEIRGR